MRTQKEIKRYLQNRGWTKMMPADLAKSISIEAAELMENFQWSNPHKADVQDDPELLNNIKKELADVMIYCFNMAIILNFDALKAVKEKVKHNKKKYPAKLMRSAVANNKYWEIKKKYRREGIN